jgi:hypothetical protein
MEHRRGTVTIPLVALPAANRAKSGTVVAAERVKRNRQQHFLLHCIPKIKDLPDKRDQPQIIFVQFPFSGLLDIGSLTLEGESHRDDQTL